MLSCCTAHSPIANISLIFQLNARYTLKYVHFYQISPKCFGTYCTILGRNSYRLLKTICFRLHTLWYHIVPLVLSS